jgi:hypothetical protein
MVYDVHRISPEIHRRPDSAPTNLGVPSGMASQYVYRIQTVGEIQAECYEREADGLAHKRQWWVEHGEEFRQRVRDLKVTAVR